MNLNFWPKMYYSGGGGGGGSGGGGGGAGGGGAGGSGGAGGGYGGGAGAGGAGGDGGGAAGEQPPYGVAAGAFRFNTDTLKLEYYDGNQWVNVVTDSPHLHTGDATSQIYHTTTNLSTGEGTRGVTAGINEAPQWQEHMDFFNISSTGNSTDFGDMAQDIFACGATASSTRGIVMGGYHPSNANNNNEIQFVTIASQGNATDFGDLTVGRASISVSGSQTRAVAAGGAKTPGVSNVIDFVTIASTGNAVDFGDIDITYSNSVDGGCGSPTRGISHQRATDLNGTFFHFNIATTGNAAEFSDNINSGNNTLSAGSNAVRGLFQGGYNVNAISAVTISTLGSAFDFGDQTTKLYTAGAAASGTRYVTIAGQPIPAAPVNTMEYVQIMTTGNTVDFGDLSRSGYYVTGMSNGHGGLG